MQRDGLRPIWEHVRYGGGATLPLYSEGDDPVEVDTVTVLDAKRGSPPVWTIRFADPAIVTIYTVDSTERRNVSYAVTNRKSAAMFYVRR